METVGDSSVGNSEIAKPRLRAALTKVRPEFAQLADSDLKPVNIDVLGAVTIARGALPKIRALRGDFERECKTFDYTLIDRLETYCLATMQTEGNFGSSVKDEALPKLVAEALKLREGFLVDARALAKRGGIDGRTLRKLKGVNGFFNVSTDVLMLATIFRNAWDAVSTKSGVTLEELDRAEVLADDINEGLGRRQHRQPGKAAAALERQQAFTLMVTAYDKLRRAVTYVRWEQGDADKIAPSLYGGRRRPKKVENAEEAERVDAPEASAVVASPAVVNSEEAHQAVAVGLPGANPFE
jgi:hypothetical protein